MTGLSLEQVRGITRDCAKHWTALYRAQRRKTRILTRLEHGRLLEVAIEHRLMHVETLCYMLHQLPIGPQIHRGRGSAADCPRRTFLAWSKYPRAWPHWACRPQPWRIWLGQRVPAASSGSSRVCHRCAQRDESGLLAVHAGRRLHRSRTVERRRLGVDHFLDRRHPAFWVPRGTIRGSIGRCFRKFPCRSTGPFTLAMMRRAPMPAGLEKNCPAKRNGIAPPADTRGGTERAYPWGSESPSSRHGNFDFHRWDPVACRIISRRVSDFGVADLAGNGWEWTRTPFAPFPGFEPFSFYPGYSANFFDGKHFVMKGGSPRTAACMLRRSFRNWFQPHYPYVYATFRCVTNAEVRKLTF